MPWGNVYAGPASSDSELMRALTAATQAYAVAQKKRRHSQPSKSEPLTPEGPYGFTGPPEGYWLDSSSPYASAGADVPEALAYLNAVSEAETKAKVSEARVSPVTRKVLQARRDSVKQSRMPQGMRVDNTATTPLPWYDESLGGGSGLPQPGPGSMPKTPWQRFFTTLGDLFSGTGDESYASYEKMMGGR
jgi:hypothetical protein